LFIDPKHDYSINFLVYLEKAAIQLQENGIMVAKFDSVFHKDEAKAFNASGYPVLSFFNNG
jgi:hypothetical protein